MHLLYFLKGTRRVVDNQVGSRKFGGAIMDKRHMTGGGMETERMDSRGQQRKRLKTTHHHQSNGESVNSRSVKRNPFLIDLVLEKVFSYSKRLDPDNFKNYRLVCKLWDAEVLKLLRPDTQINLSRIISPLPEGLGWIDDESGGSGCQASYPFQNVVVTGTCENLMDPQLARWFETEGSKVKQLQFISRLTCYHHIRFLECVLKNWCQNLTQLSLAGVDSICTLVNESGFVDPGDIICTNIRELILSVDAQTTSLIFNKDCGEHLPQIYLNQEGLYLERGRRARVGLWTPLASAFMDMMHDTRPILEYFGSGHADAFARMRNYEVENGGSLVSPKHQLAIQQVLQSTDGGVLGQLVKSAPVSNLILWKVEARLIRIGLIPLFYCRPNTLRQSLSQLTIREETSGDLGMAFTGMMALRMMRMIPYPLVTLKIGPLHVQTVRTELFNFVGSFSDTLEHLEVKGRIIPHEDIVSADLELPLLPKIKSFFNEDALGYQLTDFEFLGNMPNLERGELLVQANSNPDEVEEMTREMFESTTFEVGVHPLKELKMELPISIPRHIELMTNWFPGLVKVDLVLTGGRVLDAFFRMSNHLPLVDVKLTFQLSEHGNGDYENAIAENLSKNENLQFLQLIHLLDWPAPFSERIFELGFAKGPKLTSLKLTNFKILTSKHRVRNWLSHISCVQLTKVTFQRRQEIDELDFSVGRSHF